MRVFVSDFDSIASPYKTLLETHAINFEEDQHTESRILQADLIVKSPGISESAAIIKSIRKAGITLVSEIEFASWFTNAFIIAVTGSNGKTTTTALIGHALQQAGMDVCVAGNIGFSFAAALVT
ncbi:MAG: UDP-N-acetylmuramoyl-L-alanine--D-glutamate ligase, partial [Bacteroidetes bacterium]|nr:UDP-N-acetylmuramoyl-L-alanine--D-glutamate ligase [Bacteroidota bacterium]